METAEKECGALGGLFQAIVNDMKRVPSTGTRKMLFRRLEAASEVGWQPGWAPEKKCTDSDWLERPPSPPRNICRFGG
uniref:Uncharacterized protein n=1 Tax=Sphaerodactylus townsendi TaxID=933632 RepID=A0ACB8EBC0_9SAUR